MQQPQKDSHPTNIIKPAQTTKHIKNEIKLIMVLKKISYMLHKNLHRRRDNRVDQISKTI